MNIEEAKKILTEYVKACNENDMLRLEQFVYEEVIEAMSMGAEALSVLPVSSDLEEAAEEYAYTGIPDEMKCVVKPAAEQIIKNFIAGAKWQKKQDDKCVDIIYQQGIEKGKDDIKEQMMKEAVEGHVWVDYGYDFSIPSCLQINLGPNKGNDEVHDGDKVRVIIVKED